MNCHVVRLAAVTAVAVSFHVHDCRLGGARMIAANRSAREGSSRLGGSMMDESEAKSLLYRSWVQFKYGELVQVKGG